MLLVGAFVFMLAIEAQLARKLPDGTFWLLDDAWSDCSMACGPGVMTRQARCYRQKFSRGMTTPFELLPDSNCDETTRPATVERACDFGPCNSQYRWSVSNWEVCSQLCGPRGTRNREVDCVFRGAAGDQPVSHEYCLAENKPHTSEACNRIDCVPRFEPDEWQKCQQDDPCQAGKQKREVFCKALLANGDVKQLSQANCFRLGYMPMSTWRKCFIPSFSSQCKTLEPEIEKAPAKTVVQMAQEGDKIALQVGEEGYIIPSTRVTIKCPVKFYASQDLVWIHENHGRLTYLGHSVERVHVDKEGNLLIKNFKLADRGEWHCIAGNHNSTVMLMARTPAEAFSDFVSRQSLINTQAGSIDLMMNEDPKTYLEASESQIRWVEGPWSECSVKCGQQGNQRRSVRCEELQARVYHVLNDSVCESKHLPKPLTIRECQTSLVCPAWEIAEINEQMCTDYCVAPGKGATATKLICKLGEKTVSEMDCQNIAKPVIECENPRCQLAWWMSEWSQCSKSCGGIGVQSRTLRCVWNHDGSSAKSLCFDHELKVPEAVRACETEPCETGCIDLSAVCKKSADYCRISTYRYHCCKSCRDLFMEQSNSPNDEK